MAWRDTFLRRIHLCIGAFLSLPLVMIGLTGSILVFEPELSPSRGFGVASEGPVQSFTAMVEAARGSAREGLKPSLVIAPAAAGDLAEIRFSDPARPGPGGLQVFVDPVSLDVRGAQQGGDGWLRTMFFWHANMMVRDRSGREVGGWFGVAMCVLAVTGIIMQWPKRRRWRQAVTISSKSRGYRLLREVHGAIGFWSWLVLLIVSFSGVWLSFPQAFNGWAAAVGVRDLRPGIAGSGKVATVEGATPLNADGVAALAMAAAPGKPLRWISIPARADQPYRVMLGEAHSLATVAFVDPFAQRVTELRDPRDYAFAERIVASMHAIHDGSGLGVWWRALVFFSGLLPAIFAVSGILMWVGKYRTRRKMTRGRFDIASAPGE
jgi:uncharacterized iron-regulated membrane protein